MESRGKNYGWIPRIAESDDRLGPQGEGILKIKIPTVRGMVYLYIH